MLHPLGVGPLLVTLAQHLADVEYGHVVTGLQLGDRTLLLDHPLEVLLDTLLDVEGADLHRVDDALIVEQLLHQQVLERFVEGIAVGSVALLPALGRQLRGVFVHFGLQDRRAAHHGDDPIEHHLPFLGGRHRRHSQQPRQQKTFPKHTFLFLFR